MNILGTSSVLQIFVTLKQYLMWLASRIKHLNSSWQWTLVVNTSVVSTLQKVAPHLQERLWERKQMKERKLAKAYSYSYFWSGLFKISCLPSNFICLSARATMTKISQNGWLKWKKFLVSPFWKIEAWNQGVNRFGSFWGLWERVCCSPLSLTCRWLSSHLHGTLSTCTSISKCSLFTRAHQSYGLVPMLMTS